MSGTYQRRETETLRRRLRQPRHLIQVVSGPRQVGKSTMVQQAVETLATAVRHASADEPTLRGPEWINQQWDAARIDAMHDGDAILHGTRPD